jgi:hypothetical protein
VEGGEIGAVVEDIDARLRGLAECGHDVPGRRDCARQNLAYALVAPVLGKSKATVFDEPLSLKHLPPPARNPNGIILVMDK